MQDALPVDQSFKNVFAQSPPASMATATVTYIKGTKRAALGNTLLLSQGGRKATELQGRSTGAFLVTLKPISLLL